MKKQNFLNIIVVVFLFFSSCTTEQERMETRLKKFIAAYEQLIIPLYREMALTSWNANITGKDEDLADSERASFEFSRVYTDVSAFNELKMIKESGSVKDPLLIRQLDLLYDAYLGNQVDTSLISERLKMETEISRKYLNFRARVNGKDLSDNEVEDILRNSRNSQELKSAWEGHKMIGPVVVKDIIDLVKHRNRIAKLLGFSNYHEMSLNLSGQDPEEVTSLLDELDNLTKENFIKLKRDIDINFRKLYRIFGHGNTRTGISRKRQKFILSILTNTMLTRIL